MDGQRRDVRQHEDGSVSWVEDGEPGRELHITEGPPDNAYRTVEDCPKAHERRAEFIGTGTVWLAARPDAQGRLSGYSGYWSASDSPTVLEHAGFHATAESAVAWGRARTPRVLFRPPGHDDHLWAGEGENPWPHRGIWQGES